MFGINNQQNLFTHHISSNINNDTSNIFTRNSPNRNITPRLLVENKPEDITTNNYYSYTNSENSDRSSKHSEYSKNTINSENNENNENNINNINEFKNTIDSFKKEIDELKNLIKLQIKINSNKNNGVYIKCNLHEHLLKETVVCDLLDVYKSGFVCDNCNYKQHNINEKFYHCQECSSISGIGNYDLCIECVKKHF